MKQTILSIGLLCSLLTSPSWAMPAPPPSPNLIQGDEAFKQRASAERAQEALSTYRRLYQKSPSNPDLAWRLSMACYFVGLRLTPDGEREKIFEEGRNAGLASVQNKPDCAPCHFWTAINMALYGKEIGVFKMLFTLSDIKKHLQASLLIDPNYAQGGAQRLLGAIEENLPGILGGSDERAKTFYEQAIAASPDEPLNFLFLARLLLKSEKTSAEGLSIARKGSLISVLDQSRIESIEAQAELKNILSKNDPRKN